MWLRYRLSSDEMRDFGPDVSPIIESEAGTLLTSAIGFTYDYGELNSSVSPTDGFNFVLNGDFAGLGGETNYTKAEISLTGYKSFFDEELVLSAELAGGALLWQNDAGSRAIDRFFLGGEFLRGFAYAGIGPRDKAGDVNDTLGGNYYGVARVQASFPIGLPAQYGVYGGVFLDAGSVSGLDNVEGGASGTIDDSPYLRVAAGVSLFWETPVGPLRFNFSRALRKREYDEVENFRFTVGTRF